MLLKILIICSLTICKRTLKRICKNKTCGASVVQNVKNKETIHAYLKRIFIGFIPSNLCTYIMQTSSIMHFYTCFGLCWHQSPKRPRKGSNKESKRQPKGTLVWRTGLSDVPPDSVRCTREPDSELATFGNSGSRSAIIHRTVRYSTGLSGVPAE